MNKLRVDKLEEYQCPYVERHCLGDKCVAWNYKHFSRWVGVLEVYNKLEKESRPTYKAWFSGEVKYRDEGCFENYLRRERVWDELYADYEKEPGKYNFVKVGVCAGQSNRC